ncbi:hypothetical protein MesoLjLc_58590 [Mesorhizobium sp. L-8-10]|uniref:hypothetical protein n=1 Tax=unclassified Mesorhizobium TaxID=325217 RepID=UPI0019297EBA|nr:MULTISPECIES: hypothetical protein [unclassified Mesorhizobium]BCH25945.1 hypothetical protein MesoLjLb_57300 [Mesorhizobium sp. L-8-3]BCH33929.1 hypothetical protein MesoLjLc_58590 [Mesorhizobium sp. L-8-10]
MLARRFTIVCLLMALFGILLSILVAETSRKARSWEIGMIVPCVMEQGLVCAPPARN